MGRLLREAKGQIDFYKGQMRLYEEGISCYVSELDNRMVFEFSRFDFEQVIDLRIEGLFGKHLTIICKNNTKHILKVPEQELEDWKRDINDMILKHRGGRIISS